MVRWARTQVFTECRFEDADTPGRVLGAGAANWSVMFPTPEGFEYTDPGSGLRESPETPSMTDAFELEPGDDGAWVLPALSPRVGAEVLHHGPMLVATEQSALAVGARAAGTDALALRSWTMRIVKAGRKAPFTATSEVLSVAHGIVGDSRRTRRRRGRCDRGVVPHPPGGLSQLPPRALSGMIDDGFGRAGTPSWSSAAPRAAMSGRPPSPVRM